MDALLASLRATPAHASRELHPRSKVVWLAAAAIVGRFASWSSVAEASPQARLVYGRSGAADSCPDERALRRAVAARIGYDPFFPFAPRTVVVVLSGSGNHLVAHVSLVDDEGHAQGERELESQTSNCGGLFDTVALTISIAIDPHALERQSQPADRDQSSAATQPAPATQSASVPLPAPAAEPEGPVPPPAEPPSEARPLPPAEPPLETIPSTPPAPSHRRWRLGAALRGSLGPSPAFAFGGSLYADVAWSRASIGLEAQGDLPASKHFGPSSLTAWIVSGAFVPCLRFPPLDVCALAVVGRLDVTAANVIHPSEQHAVYVAAGGRIGLVVPLAERIFLRAEGDVLGNVDPARVNVGSTREWRASLVGGTLALGVLASF